MVNAIVIERKTYGLAINRKKTEEKDITTCDITVKGQQIHQISSFNLGSTITSNGLSDGNIKKRIAMAQESLINMSSMLKNKHVCMTTRMHTHKCYIWSSPLYGCEQ